jgi:4-amino-4-deoxy-L-arabinose transferase-like glycosyltransferase
MAVQPQHVANSFWALTDVPLTFFVVLTLVESLSAARGGRPWEFFLAGAAAGFATATKYNGVITLIMPLCALAGALPGIRPRLAAAAAAIGGIITGFLLGAPFSLIDLPSFLNGFARLMQFYNAEQPATEVARGYFTFITQWFSWPGTVPLWIGLPGLLLCGFGFVALAVRLRSRDARPVALALLVFPPAYFWFISNQSMQFGRYALPLAPFLAIAFGVGVTVAAQMLQKRLTSPVARRVALTALVLPLLAPLGYSLWLNSMRATISPSEQAARWLIANVQSGEPVIVEGRAMLQLPRRIQAATVNRAGTKNIDQYKEDGTAYIVLSSAEYQQFLDNPYRDRVTTANYNSIFRESQQVQAFNSTNTNFMPTIRIQKIVR